MKRRRGSSGRSSGKQRGRFENIRDHCFKPGQSGNPAGKMPSTMKGLTACLRHELAEASKTGIPAEVLMAKKLVALALRGNLLAIRECFDRIEGKARQAIDWTDRTSQIQELFEGR